MTTEKVVVSEETRIQLLVPYLTLEDVEQAILEKLKRCGYAYKNVGLHPNAPPQERQPLSAQFIKTTYDIARVLEDERELYNHFNGNLFESDEESQETLKPVEIFESVLIYSLGAKSRRWRAYASKIARIYELSSKEGLSANDVVSRFEGVGGIEKFI